VGGILLFCVDLYGAPLTTQQDKQPDCERRCNVATEVLRIPEESLQEVISVIRIGIERKEEIGVPLTEEVKSYLEKWCDEEEACMCSV
jgi:hypothetical protein